MTKPGLSFLPKSAGLSSFIRDVYWITAHSPIPEIIRSEAHEAVQYAPVEYRMTVRYQPVRGGDEAICESNEGDDAGEGVEWHPVDSFNVLVFVPDHHKAEGLCSILKH
mmetsp:Transcript_12681/g.15319  ORF Transcript_12681/g.15319 Transcript_12681/m.15319 type:complete len:109 (-) Transcript_12681:20-346(-)